MKLNRGRILSRLRSKHTKNWRAKAHPSLLQKLQAAKSLLLSSSAPSPRIQSLVDDVDNIQTKFDRLEDMEPPDARSARADVHLLDLVKAIHSILLLYEQDFKRVPCTPTGWTGIDTESLIDRVRKISQYVIAGEELLRAARRYKIFSSIGVEFIDIQQANSPLSKIHETIEASCNLDTISRVSKFRKTEIDSTKESLKLRLTKLKFKLHAEIKLILHSGRSVSRLRPRVICASKSACYLCQLFAKLHGQFYIPSTHGRLYDSWKWPALAPHIHAYGCVGDDATQDSLLSQFTKAIDDKLQELLHNASLARHAPPLESTVDLLAAMTPSILSTGSQFDPQTSMAHTERRDSISEVTSEASEEDEDTSSVSSTKTVGGPATVPQTALAIDPPGGSPGSDGMLKEPLRLQTGETASRPFSVENSFLRVHVPGLHLRFRYLASPAQSVDLENGTRQVVGDPLQLEMECLSASSETSEASQASAVDLDEGHWLEKSALESALFSDDGLLLKRRSTLLRLHARIF